MVGVLVSTGMHLGLGVAVARYGRLPGAAIRLVSEPERPQADGPKPQHTPPPPPDRPRAEPPEPEPAEPALKELKLGLADSPDSASVAWQGFTEPTENKAREGMTEQSAMSLRPAPAVLMDAPAGTPGANPGAPDPAPSAPAAAAVAGAPEGDIERPAESAAPLDLRPVGKALMDAGEKLAEAIGQALERAPAAGPERSAEAEEPRPAHPESAPPPAERLPVAKGEEAQAARPGADARPPGARPGQAGTAGGMPGLKSDRESIAVALRNAPVVVPGRVLAAQGLEVLTRAPRFDTLTVATQRPRNPAVRVFFGRDGKVKRAEWVSGEGVEYSTGSVTVDRQLMNSIYAWTAKGRAVDELPAGDPEAAVSIVFTILLR